MVPPPCPSGVVFLIFLLSFLSEVHLRRHQAKAVATAAAL